MNEQLFYQSINEKARLSELNPLLLLSGIEGLYTFKDVQLNAINYEFLDSLILTIFALRIGDQFQTIAQQNLNSEDYEVKLAAINELHELSSAQIEGSNNAYLQSFSKMIGGQSPVRKLHEKALDVAALEIRKAQLRFENESISIIILAICKDDPNNSLGLNALFASGSNFNFNQRAS